MDNIEKVAIKLKGLSKVMAGFGLLGELFDEEIILREEIFKHFYLPGQSKHLDIIFKYVDDDLSFSEMMAALQKESDEYLLSSPKSIEQILVMIQNGKLAKHDALGEIGISPSTYAIFIFEKLEDDADIKLILNDIQLIIKHEHLTEKIFMLKSMDNPLDHYLYSELSSLGLCFLDDYLEIKTYENITIIHGFHVEEILFDKNMVVFLLCYTNDDEYKGLFTLDILLSEIIEIFIDKGVETSLLINEMIKRRKADEDFYVIKTKDLYGDFIKVENRNLIADASYLLDEIFDDNEYAKKYKFIQLV